MKTVWVLALGAQLFVFGSASGAGPQEPGFREWLADVRGGLAEVARLARAGDLGAARNQGLRIYLDRYELLEGYYGAGGAYEREPLARRIGDAEAGFHILMRGQSAQALIAATTALKSQLDGIELTALQQKVPLYPTAAALSNQAGAPAGTTATTPEVLAMLQLIGEAERAVAAGDRVAALSLVERLYLENFEPLESRLPSRVVGPVERTVHLVLRPALRDGNRPAEVTNSFNSLRGSLVTADRFLAGDASFWFGAANSFAILVREGLEAVLLVGALLAYLTAAGASKRDRARIWTGVGLGILASGLTWVIARTVVPIGGANRELVEGITALVAVGVLLYVSNWLFQKTYIHDWKTYLREHLGEAVSRGSALAMAGLAFAAVYREGFETVLFYQALMLDAGTTAVLTGFLPAVLVILAVGYGILKAGVKLPLKKVFATTNAILIYLAVVFTGKGIYNLQESGLFTGHPLRWLPESEWLVQIFGFHGMLETLLGQVLLLTLLTATYAFYRQRAGAAALRAATA